MKIFSVNQVTVTRVNESPLTLAVQASGLTSTSGWTNPKLDNSADPTPKDAVLEFSFEADRPTGIAMQVLTPIMATVEVKPKNGADAVIVTSRSNSVTVHASEFIIPTPSGRPGMTTHIFLEESPTTFPALEENLTTLPVSEEGHPPTTMALGEEFPTFRFHGAEGGKTLRFGEEGPMTDPRLDDPMGPLGGGFGPFGTF